MKLWIIIKSGIGFPKIVAETIYDRLEYYIDINVGMASKIEPSYLVEEKLDCLIIGDSINEAIPSLEIQNWMLKYNKISHDKNLVLKVLAGFFVTLGDIPVKALWVKFLEDYIKADLIYHPILHLKVNKEDFSLEDRNLDLIKEYTSNFIEFIMNIETNKGNC
jgi:hypothetical protein